MDTIPFKLDDLKVADKLFEKIRYCIAGTVDPKILKLLEDGQGIRRTNALVSTTHVIAGPDADAMTIEEAKDLFDLPVVRPSWVAFCAKFNTIVPIWGFSAAKDQVFLDVVVTSVGLTPDDVKKLWASVVYHGGRYSAEFNGDVTHVIANSSKIPLYDAAKERNLPVVCLDWVNDCLKASKLVNAEEYDPSLLRSPLPKSVSQPPPPPSTATPTKKEVPKTPGRILSGSHSSPAVARLKSGDLGSSAVMPISTPPPAPTPKPKASQRATSTGGPTKRASKSPSQAKSTTPKKEPSTAGGPNVSTPGMPSAPQKTPKKVSTFATPVGPPTPGVQHSPMSKAPPQSPLSSPIPQSPSKSPGPGSVPPLGGQSPAHHGAAISMTSPHSNPQTPTSHQQMLSHMQGSNQQPFLQPPQSPSGIKGSMMMGNQQMPFQSVPQPQQSPQHSMVHSPQAQQKMIQLNFSMKSPLGSQPMPNAGMHHSPVQSPAQSVASPLQGQNMGFTDQNQMMQMQNNQQFNQKLMSPMHQSEQDMQQMMGSPLSSPMGRQQMMPHHKPQQYGANQNQPGTQGSFQQQQVPVSQNQNAPKLQQHLMGQQMQPQGNQSGMMQIMQQNMGGGNYQMNPQQMHYQQQMNQQIQHPGQQMPMQQHQHMMQKQGNLQMQQGTTNVQVPQQSPQQMQSNSPLQHSQITSQQLQMQGGMSLNQQGQMSQQNQQQQPGMMQTQNNMNMLQSPSTPPVNQGQFSQQQGQGLQMQQNRQFQMGQQQIPMNQGSQMSQQMHMQQGQMPMQQGQMQPGMGQQMQMQQGQAGMQGPNTMQLPQGQQMQQLQNQRMQMQQPGQGQMQMQQPGQGQMQMQQPGQGQMQMQQPGQGQMQMQQPGPGQMQMQQPGQGQMQMQQPGQGQMQMQQPGQGQMQMQQPGQGQMQMQQPGQGQMQIQQPGQGQMQMQQPGQGQMQMQQSGPGQMQMKQPGIPQQMQLQGQQGGSLQQMQPQAGMQMQQGMQMQNPGGPQMVQSGVPQQNMGQMGTQMQVPNQPGSPQIQQQGQLGSAQVQNMSQGQYQYQLQQGQGPQQSQQVVQVLQVPGQMQQNMARGPTGPIQMRQQGVVTQQMNMNQVRMAQNAPRQMMGQQQSQQLRSTLPMSPSQMTGMQGQQRPMQPQQTMMGQQQQVGNRMQLPGGQHIVNVNAPNDQNQPNMVQFQTQPQQGSQQLQQLLQQPHSQQGIRQPAPGQQVPMNPTGSQQQGGQPMPQQKPFGLRPQIQQEIIRQISSDPNLKQQFQMMDQQQRSLWIQQFLQRQRDKEQQMVLQQRMVNQQVQQQRFVGAGTGQMGTNAQRPQSQMIVQPGGVVRTQQIFTPQVGSPRLNVRHVLVHQGSRLAQPQGQTQQIIIQQQQGTAMPPQQSPQHGQNVNQIILQSGAGQQVQNQMPIQQSASQGSHNLNQQQQIIHVQVPGQAGMQQIIRQPGQTPGSLQGANVTPQATQQNMGPRTQIIGPNNVLIQQTSNAQQGMPGQPQLPPGAKVALIQSSQQWVTPGGTVVRSPSPALQMQGQMARPGMDGSMSPAGTMQGQWPVRQGSPAGTPPGFVQNQGNIPYVNSKTKTALANLLSNRLQGNAGDPTISGHVPVGVQSPQQQVVMCPPPPPPVNASAPHSTLSTVQMQTSPQQNLLVQRTPLNTMAGGMKPVQRPLIRTPGGIPPPPGATLPLAQRPTYYGHDPNQKLPADGFLLGCVFWVPIPLSVKNLKQIIEERWGELEQENGNRVTHVLCETTKFPEFQQVVKEGKRLVTLHWLSDCCVKKIVKPPCYAIHLPVPFLPEDKPLKDDLVGITGFSGENKQRVELMCNMLGAQVVKHLARNVKMLVANKPEGPKFTKAREWKMPVVNVQFLNELLFGHMSSLKSMHSPKYQQFNSEPFRFEVALVPHLMAAWKQPIRFIQEHLDKYNSRKRSADGQIDASAAKKLKRDEEHDIEPLTPPEIPVDENHPATASTDNKVEESVSEDVKPDIKKDIFRRPVAVMLSGFARESKEKITKKIILLGGKVTSDYRETTHLIMKESLRTNKLFVCLSRARYIVGLDWLRECLKKNHFVDAEPFILSNETIENVYGVKLKDLLAKPDRHLLLANVTFFVTPSCFPSVPDLQEIIEAAGGQIDKKQRSLQVARQQALKSPRRYVIITCTQDFKLVADACKRHAIHLHTPEFIFDSIAKQKFKPMKSFAKLLPLGDKGGFKLPLQARKV